MVLLLLPWLLRGSRRPEYAAAQASFGHEDVGWEVGASARLLACLIAARFAFNAALRGPTRRLAAARSSSAGSSSSGGGGGVEQQLEADSQGRRLLEELWVTLGNLLILGAALFVMLHRNGGCWFLNTSTCLAGWPDLPADPAVKLYYNLELAWYLHMLLKPVLRYGLPDGRDMLIHHAATLMLILVSYGTNLTRIGVVVLALFAISNPLLHIAKICNQLCLGPLKVGGFLAFALAFFFSRVLLVPWAVLKVAALDSRQQIPYAVEDFHAIYLAINALLAALYLMQLVWMKGIVRVLAGSAVRHGSEAASRMSAKLDPAKRYAVSAEPPAQQAEQAKQQQAAAAGSGASDKNSSSSGKNSSSSSGRGAAKNGSSGSKSSGSSPAAAAGAPARGGGKQGGLPATPSPVDPPVLQMAAEGEGPRCRGAAAAGLSSKK